MLETISRRLIRCLVAVFTAAVVFLSQSLFWTNAVSPWTRCIVVGVALVSYFRPHNGLLLVAALVPLGQIGSGMLGSQMRGGEALVLAFLAGALIRSWTLHRFRDFPSTRLDIAALFFGIVIAASCIEQMWFLQIQRPASFVTDLARYGARDYLTSFREFRMIFHAMLLVEGTALLLYAAHYCHTRPGFSVAVVRMLAAGATAAAAVSLGFVWSEFLETGEPVSQLWRLFEGKRWPAHVGDINAAGSFFVFATLLSLSAGLFGAGQPVAWVALAFVSGLVMWTTASRTALVAFLLVGAFVFVKHVLTRPRRLSLMLGTAAACIAALAVWRFPVQLAGSIAWEGVTFRWAFLGTTLRMVAAQPLFGVGVGQYSLWSSRFIPAELIGSPYASENAHNNFGQIAGELGLVGLVAFMGVLVVVLTGLRDRRARIANPLAMAVLAGIAAFMVTWFGGHPLLVPEVAYPFWIALGALAGILPSPSGLGQKALAMVAIAAVVLAASIPWRVIEKQKLMNLPHVTQRAP